MEITPFLRLPADLHRSAILPFLGFSDRVALWYCCKRLKDWTHYRTDAICRIQMCQVRFPRAAAAAIASRTPLNVAWVEKQQDPWTAKPVIQGLCRIPRGYVGLPFANYLLAGPNVRVNDLLHGIGGITRVFDATTGALVHNPPESLRPSSQPLHLVVDCNNRTLVRISLDGDVWWCKLESNGSMSSQRRSLPIGLCVRGSVYAVGEDWLYVVNGGNISSYCLNTGTIRKIYAFKQRIFALTCQPGRLMARISETDDAGTCGSCYTAVFPFTEPPLRRYNTVCIATSGRHSALVEQSVDGLDGKRTRILHLETGREVVLHRLHQFELGDDIGIEFVDSVLALRRLLTGTLITSVVLPLISEVEEVTQVFFRDRTVIVVTNIGTVLSVAFPGHSSISTRLQNVVEYFKRFCDPRSLSALAATCQTEYGKGRLRRVIIDRVT